MTLLDKFFVFILSIMFALAFFMFFDLLWAGYYWKSMNIFVYMSLLFLFIRYLQKNPIKHPRDFENKDD